MSKVLAKYNSHCCGDKYLRSIKDKIGQMFQIHIALKVQQDACWRDRQRPQWPDVRDTCDIICLGQPEKSTVAKDRFDTGQNTDFGNTSILDKETGHRPLDKSGINNRLQTRKGWWMEFLVSVGPRAQELTWSSNTEKNKLWTRQEKENTYGSVL